ncbi:glycosyltransferase family protein [Pedobacter endophyticus]|uniref:Glycosyltransferase n=1 Tax=Pedobacter endophyticus TaxID=2789740 RepID=A0A7U3Q4C5_9SPHI|nr:glycosyltransferase [Pedobacter endophyticus]QPH38353.1 glycosyltransferase [Pedobacter endophyticus]
MDDKLILRIVIVNFNGDNDTIACIDSILESTDKLYQIFIVDNSPSGESIDRIVHWLQEVNSRKTNYHNSVFGETLYKIFSKYDFELINDEIETRIVIVKDVKNHGFAAANNICIKYLSRVQSVKWIWLLNNDTLVPPSTIRTIKEGIAQSRANTGIYGTKLYYAHEKGMLQGVAGQYNFWTATSKHLGGRQADYNYSYEKFIREADYIIGASMIVSKAFVNDVGFMNEEYFLYYEEIDWAFRGKNKGWQIDLIPSAYIYHKEGASISKTANNISLLADKCFVVNRLKITKKYAPNYLLSVYASILLVLVNRILRGQFSHILPIVRALVLNNPLL